MIRLQPDFNEFLKLFNDHRVEYLLIGGYAVIHHGYTRSTGDLDVWINSTPENAQRILEALHEFGFGQASNDLFLQPRQIIRLGVPPVRIEIHTSIEGVDFASCHAEKELIQVGDLRVPVLSLADLKRNKRAAGRLKDLADLEALDG